MRKLIYLFILLLVLVSGCREKLSPADYKKWVEDPANGYEKRIINENLEMWVLLQPRDYAAAHLFLGAPGSYKNLDEARKDLGKHSYFLIRLAAEKNTMNAVSVYIFGELENDIKLVCEKDTFSASYYLAEPYDGVTPYQNITVGFPVLLDHKKNITLWIDSSILFQQPVTISYQDRNKKLPVINI